MCRPPGVSRTRIIGAVAADCLHFLAFSGPSSYSSPFGEFWATFSDAGTGNHLPSVRYPSSEEGLSGIIIYVAIVEIIKYYDISGK